MSANNQQKYNQGGYSIIEVLVAVTVLLVALVGPLTIAAKGLQNATFARQQVTAFYLAQEGLEAVTQVRTEQALEVFRGIGSDTWAWASALNTLCASSACGVDVRTGQFFRCSASGRTCDFSYHDTDGDIRYRHDTTGDNTPFRREMTIQNNGTRVYVVSTVTWGSGVDQSVTLVNYLYDIYDI